LTWFVAELAHFVCPVLPVTGWLGPLAGLVWLVLKSIVTDIKFFAGHEPCKCNSMRVGRFMYCMTELPCICRAVLEGWFSFIIWVYGMSYSACRHRILHLVQQLCIMG
jgi:hypothetical protein